MATDAVGALAGDVATAAAGSAGHPTKVRRLLDDMEAHLIDADRYSTAMDCLIEYVPCAHDSEGRESLKMVQEWVSSDLQTAVQQARRLYYQVHEAIPSPPLAPAAVEELAPRRASRPWKAH